MKKKHLAIAVSLIVCAALAEVVIISGGKKDVPENISLELSPEVFQDNINGIDDAIIVDEVNASVIRREYDGVNSSESNHRTAASQLLNTLDNIEKMNGYSVKCNIDIQKEENGNTYCKVVDRMFGSVSDVDKYLSVYLTESMISERYSGITGGDNACLKDIDDELYVLKVRDKGEGFRWETDEEGNIIMNISDNDTNGFSIEASGHTVRIVTEDCLWKIDSID